MERGGLQLDVRPFEVLLYKENAHPIISVRGELDYATASVLQDKLAEVIAEGAIHLTVDFHGVTFFDSEGLKVLLEAYRQLRDRGGSITVRGCSRFVAKTFEVLGMESQFGVCPAENNKPNRSSP
jgi:anti-anti-sigma factor